jgi:hypothetical protein
VTPFAGERSSAGGDDKHTVGRQSTRAADGGVKVEALARNGANLAVDGPIKYAYRPFARPLADG